MLARQMLYQILLFALSDADLLQETSTSIRYGLAEIQHPNSQCWLMQIEQSSSVILVKLLRCVFTSNTCEN